MSYRPTRRELLQASGAAAMGLAIGLPNIALASNPRKEKIRFAMIGIGGMGAGHLGQAAQYGEIVALCDVDANTRSKTMLDYPRAATFSDYRAMIDAMHGSIDAVVVATPDHHHAPASSLAMRAGKHVYCQKPLTRTIGEARRLQELAKKHKVVTQMGNQGTASDDLRNAAAFVQSGKLGKVKEIHCWTDRPGGYWKQGIPRPETKRIPKHLDWDVWLGPSADRPYGDGYHTFAWRGWWDFGTGSLGDMGCHILNMPFMALDLRNPISAKAETSGHNRDSFPAWTIVHMEFAATKTRPAVTLHWYDGAKRPAHLAPGENLDDNGCLIICEQGTLYSPGAYGTGAKLLGGEVLPRMDFKKSPGHFEEWVQGIEGGEAPMSNIIGYSGPMTETILLSNLAIWADGPKLDWDARKMQVKGSNEFDALIHPQYRRGWEL